MNRINSRWTYFHKRIFPVLWGILLLVIWKNLGAALRRSPEALPYFTLELVFLAGIGVAVYVKILSPLLDEVYDAQDALVLRSGGVEERVPVESIVGIESLKLSNPKRVRITFRTPTRFGTRVVYASPVTVGSLFFKDDPAVESLRARIYSAEILKR